jgi:hypothetical protein
MGDIDTFFNGFVGKTWGTDVTEDDLKKHPKIKQVRIVKPDSRMTRDFCPIRCNVFIDDANKITQLSLC